MNKKRYLGVMLLLFVMGCAGESKQVQISDSTVGAIESEKGPKTVEFPAGTVFGGASKEQATALARIFVEAHNMAMQQFGKIAANARIREGRPRRKPKRRFRKARTQ